MLLTSAFMVVLQFFKAIGGNDDQGRYFEILMYVQKSAVYPDNEDTSFHCYCHTTWLTKTVALPSAASHCTV